MGAFSPESGLTGRQTDIFWWLRKGEDKIHQAIQADFQHLVNDNERVEAYETYASLYRNRHIDSGTSSIMGRVQTEWTMQQGKYMCAPYPLMKQVIDEVVARIARSHPRARFLTHGGNRSLKRKAKLMERWNDHLVHKLQESKLFDLGLLDACLFGLGALKFSAAIHEDEVRCERVYAGNLFVDLQETIFDRPTRLHHRRFVSREALKLIFPKKAAQIEHAGMVSDTARFTSHWGHHQSPEHDLCEIIESWHLPSFVDKNGKSPDGKRVLWIDQCILQMGPWERRGFPFAFFNWKEDPHNRFYGIGLAEDLVSTHVDANVTLRRVNKAIEMVPNPYVLARQGSQIQKSDISNAPGTIIEYQGNDPPQIITPPTVPGDLLSYVREHEMRAYKIAGLSGAQSDGGRVPSGLETGRAVESFFQVESVPFATQLKKFESFIEEVAECNVATGREIAKRNPNFTAVLPSDRWTIEELNWSEVSIDPRQDSYVIRSAPTSALSETPSARLAEVERLKAMFPNMPEAETRSLLRMPDLEKSEDLATATLDNIDRMIEAALDDGTFVAPTPFMDLDLFIIRANAEEQRVQAANEDVPEEHLATLRRMILSANEKRQIQILAQIQREQAALASTAVPQGADGQSATAVPE